MSKYKIIKDHYDFSKSDLDIIAFGLDLRPTLEYGQTPEMIDIEDRLSVSILNKFSHGYEQFTQNEMLLMLLALDSIIDVSFGNFEVDSSVEKKCQRLQSPAMDLYKLIESKLPPDLQSD